MIAATSAVSAVGLWIRPRNRQVRSSGERCVKSLGSCLESSGQIGRTHAGIPAGRCSVHLIEQCRFETEANWVPDSIELTSALPLHGRWKLLANALTSAVDENQPGSEMKAMISSDQGVAPEPKQTSGLTSAQAKARLARFGANVVADSTRRSDCFSRAAHRRDPCRRASYQAFIVIYIIYKGVALV
jgi:hypothetical protein